VFERSVGDVTGFAGDTTERVRVREEHIAA
jgi:hypothetical protein